jgi:hypothetical protein
VPVGEEAPKNSINIGRTDKDGNQVPGIQDFTDQRGQIEYTIHYTPGGGGKASKAFKNLYQIFRNNYIAEAVRSFYGLGFSAEELVQEDLVDMDAAARKPKHKAIQHEERNRFQKIYKAALEKTMVFWPKGLIEAFEEKISTTTDYNKWRSDDLLYFYRRAQGSVSAEVAKVMELLFKTSLQDLTAAEVDPRSRNIGRGTNVWVINMNDGSRHLAFSSAQPPEDMEGVASVEPYYTPISANYATLEFSADYMNKAGVPADVAAEWSKQKLWVPKEVKLPEGVKRIPVDEVIDRMEVPKAETVPIPGMGTVVFVRNNVEK